jgi:hypothetical protein
MRLSRRIGVLEKAAAALRRARQGSVEKALGKLSPADLEFLISSFGATRQGRSFSDQESVARQLYAEAVAKQCQEGRTALFTSELEIHHLSRAMFLVLTYQFSIKELQTASIGLRDQEQGRAPTEEALTVIKRWTSQRQRLAQLAGFDSEAEFDRALQMSYRGVAR